MNLTEDREVLAVGQGNSPASEQPQWLTRAEWVWQHRRFLMLSLVTALGLSLLIAFAIPKHYKSNARLMPPASSGASTALLAALAGKALGNLSSLSGLASGLLGSYNATAVVVDLLRSGSIANDLITRFDLQQVYAKRYRSDAAKALKKHTTISDDKKSGIITITVEDKDPQRARDIAQAYIDELNTLVNHTSTSSAHQERMFIDGRLAKVRADLQAAQERLSEFASTHATVDIKEQARAVVDTASRLEAQKIVEEASLQSLRQIYGEDNVRVRAAQSRIGVLQNQVSKLGGSSSPLGQQSPGDKGNTSPGTLTPSLRQLPRLAVPYADLYREVQVQEAVFELLTQQDELARIQEAKDIPVINVIDAPGVPDKKSFPPRLLLTLVLTAAGTACSTIWLIIRQRWAELIATDPRKVFLLRILRTFKVASRFDPAAVEITR